MVLFIGFFLPVKERRPCLSGGHISFELTASFRNVQHLFIYSQQRPDGGQRKKEMAQMNRIKLGVIAGMLAQHVGDGIT
jgi:hypothetical protein